MASAATKDDGRTDGTLGHSLYRFGVGWAHRGFDLYVSRGEYIAYTPTFLGAQNVMTNGVSGSQSILRHHWNPQ